MGLFSEQVRTFQENNRLKRMCQSKYREIRDEIVHGDCIAATLTTEQKDKISSFYQRNFGENIPIIYHAYYTAYTGHFDEKYFPISIYQTYFEYYMNLVSGFMDVLEDKNFCRWWQRELELGLQKL